MLAVFCVAVGVMAVVAMRLAGDMVSRSLADNVRTAVGGDVLVQSGAVPLTADQVRRLDDLRASGVITDRLALGQRTATLRAPGAEPGDPGSLGTGNVRATLFILDDPGGYPLVGDRSLAEPAGATYASALAGPASAVVSRAAADQGHLHIGDRVHLTLLDGGAGDVTVAGIVDNRVLAGAGPVAYVSQATDSAIAERPERYGLVEVTAPDGGRAAAALRQELPAARVQTVDDALGQTSDAATQISRTLQIIGLLALLVGGIGIVNTMQVLLSRRRVEIAMLKTAGYRRRDLYALFGTEAALLGLAGGVLGTASGVGLSLLVRALMERAFAIHLEFALPAGTVLAGLGVGAATSLVFGLLPIVRASAIRPQAVIRDLPEGRSIASRGTSAGLYALLGLLFVALCAGVLGSVGLALAVVAGTGALLGLLAGVFAVVVAVTSRLPVPERLRLRQLAPRAVAVAAAAVVAVVLRPVGVILLAAVVAACSTALLTRPQKTATKLALRALGRARGRTTVTLVALFTGVFTVGLVLVLGEDLSAKIDSALGTLSDFNVIAVPSRTEASTVDRVTASLPGLEERRVTLDSTAQPVAVAGRSIADLRPGGASSERGPGLGALSGVEGYDLAAGSAPDVFVQRGRSLTAADAGSRWALLRSDLQSEPFRLALGDTVSLRGPGGALETVQVAGFYLPASAGGGGLRLRVSLQPVLVDRALAARLGGASAQTTFSLKLDPAQRAASVRQLQAAAPRTFVYDLADIAAIAEQVLGNFTTLMAALASLELIAAVVIIANAVALAMLERRRELGVLKAVGHSSRSVLSQVLIENGIVGLLAATLGMALVTVAALLLGDLVLGTELRVGVAVTVEVIGGIVALCVAAAGVVAWRSTRVRPLEVLRYE